MLSYVSTSSCVYERNGDLYAGFEAVKHIKKKYDYYKDNVKTAEDFIKYAATKSTLSGKKYKIHCPELDVQDSSDWLLEELAKYRGIQEDSAKTNPAKP